MKKLSLVLLLFSSVSVLFAQKPDTLWTKTFGGAGDDVGNSVQQTSDGGYIIAGYTNSFGAGYADVWLIKTDADGNTLWTKTLGGDNGDWANCVQQTSDGGYIIAANTYSFGAGNADFWLIKTDANGDTLWTKTIGESGYEYGYSVQQTTDDGFIIIGSTNSFGTGDYDIWLIKTDASGDTLWTKTFGDSTFGYANSDNGASVQQTPDGGYIIAAGTACGTCDPNAWLIRTNANGDSVWTKTFHNASGFDIQLTSDGGYILAGFFYLWYGDYDVWLIKTDDGGDTLWTKIFGENENEWGESVQQTSDGGYIITGFTVSFGAGGADIWLMKTDADGDTLWTNIFGGSGRDAGYSVQQTTDGGYIIAGVTESFGAGSEDVWLIKVAPDITTAIDETPQAVTDGFRLYQNYPNPFNPTTTIEFSLPQFGFVTLKVYNILGEKIAVLVSENLAAGDYKYNWDAEGLSDGVYFYRLEVNSLGEIRDFHETKKLLLMK